MEHSWINSGLDTGTMLKQSPRPSSKGGLLVLEGNLQHGGHWLMSLDSASWLNWLMPLMLTLVRKSMSVEYIFIRHYALIIIQ